MARDIPQFIGIAGAAQRLDVSTRTIARMIARGEISSTVFGRRTRLIRVDALLQLIADGADRRLPAPKRRAAEPEPAHAGASA